MKDRVKFPTQTEAETQQHSDLEAHLIGKSSDYTIKTTRWAYPVQRLDGWWDYPCCPAVDYSNFNTEPYNAANYPQPEEI